MGLGKTIQAISVACCYREAWPVLVICPSSVRLSWRAEWLRWAELQKDQVHVITHSSKTIKGRKTSISILPDTIRRGIGGPKQVIKTQVVIISYDLVPRLQTQLEEAKFQCIICDESHYLKSDTAKRTKAIIPMLQTARHCVLLSGTPALSKPIELYTQIFVRFSSIFISPLFSSSVFFISSCS